VFALDENGSMLRSEHEIDHPLVAPFPISSTSFLRQNLDSCESLWRKVCYLCRAGDPLPIHQHKRSFSTCAARLRVKRVEEFSYVGCPVGGDIAWIELELR
jgi:hypothetical protein